MSAQNHPPNQPGLEVVPDDGQSAPEYYPYSGFDPRDKDGLHPYQPYDALPISIDEQDRQQNLDVAARKTSRWRTRKCRLVLVAITAVLCLAIAGGVAGGVLRNRSVDDATTASASSSAAPAASGITTSAPSSVTSLASIRPNSPLAVTGWRETNGFEIDLYYQGPDNQLRTSKYNSGRGSVTVNNSYWENTTAISATVTGTSPLAAAMILFIDVFAPQVLMLSVDSSDRLIGVSRNPNSNPQVNNDSINSKSFPVPQTNRIASYWPYVILQDSSGELKEVVNDLNPADFHSPESEWTLSGLGIYAMTRTGIAVVPLAVNFTNIVSAGGYGIVYQGTGGQLSISVPGKTSGNSESQSWSTGTGFPTISFPKGGSIAAFATARPNDSAGRVNTYILYQAEDASIKMVWLDNDSAWKTSAPHAFAVADNGTSIACLTMPTSEHDTKSQALFLEEASSETRCYFQRGGVPREFMLSGTDWVELGSVPMP